jgi:hypothetical protein
MVDAQAPAETTIIQDSIADAAFQANASQVAVASMPRENLQQAEQISPSIRPMTREFGSPISRTQSSQNKTESAFREISKNPPTTITRTMRVLAPLKNQQQEKKLDQEIRKFSATQALIGAIIFLKKEMKEFYENPVEYLKQGINNIIESTVTFGRNILNSLFSMPSVFGTVLNKMRSKLYEIIISISVSQESKSDSTKTNKSNWIYGRPKLLCGAKP